MSTTQFPLSHTARLIFGESATVYGKLINDIGHELFRERYYFEAMETFDIASPQHKRRVYWLELLRRAHLASVASIVRATAWIDCATREYDAQNLYGWAAACRSLIEAGGDTLHSLRRVPIALAANHRLILADLAGKGNEILISTELEDDLIHFTHGRKIEKGSTAPDSHKAKQSWQYVKLIEDMSISGVAALYSELCEIVHPAAASVLTLIEEDVNGWRISRSAQVQRMSLMANDARLTLSNVLMACYNAPLLILRVLHKFKIFQPIDSLRKYNFDQIKDWPKISAALRS